MEFFATCYLYFVIWNIIWRPVVNFVNGSPIYMQFYCQAIELKIFSRWYDNCQNSLNTLCASTNDVWMIRVCNTLCRPSANPVSFTRQPMKCEWYESAILFVDLRRIPADYPDKYRLRMTKWAAAVLITHLLHPTYHMITAAADKNVGTWENAVFVSDCKSRLSIHTALHWLLTLVTLVQASWTNARNIIKIVLHIAPRHL